VANEVGKHGVRVNCVAPSAVLTERVQRLLPEAQQHRGGDISAGAAGAPEDVALATLFLASNSSSWLTASRWGTTRWCWATTSSTSGDVAGGKIML
jgi:3-oxoacyl-[acyl-carrier protein] reductase